MTQDEPEDSFTQDALDLAKAVHPMFAGKPAPVVGAALADLVSLLIAGHIADTPHATKRLRDMLLDEHIKAVKKLIPMQEEMLKQRASKPPQERPN